MTIVHSQILKVVFTKGVELIVNEDGMLEAFHNKMVLGFDELPQFAYDTIKKVMGNPNATIEEMHSFAYKYWGGFDDEADIAEDGTPSEPEFVSGVSEAYSANGTTISKAQMRVLKHIPLDDREIADKLFMSRNTVARHCQDVYMSTGINKRAQLAIWALNKGII